MKSFDNAHDVEGMGSVGKAVDSPIDTEKLHKRIIELSKRKQKWSHVATNYCKARKTMLQFAVDDEDGQHVDEFNNELDEVNNLYIFCLEQFRLNDSMLHCVGECLAHEEISDDYKEMEQLYDNIIGDAEYVSACEECETKGLRWGLMTYDDIRNKFGSRLQ